MTTYGYDPDTGSIVAVWHTPAGPQARTVAVWLDSVVPTAVLNLAGGLTLLSNEAWKTFTAPATAAGDADEVNSEAWRRLAERDSFGDALEALTKPNLPSGGTLARSYLAVLEVAHQVGRALHELNDADLTNAVASEVSTEFSAVELAELGDLSGRAAQATALSRVAASPLQVEAASAALDSDLLGESLRTFEPSAAAVAATRWLRAAAEVAGEASDAEWTEVVQQSDDITARPTAIPTQVLEMLALGLSPQETTSSLIEEALSVASGRHLDPTALALTLEDALNDEDDVAEGGGAQGGGLRLTLLDPTRPALDLLEDLLTGIDGCFEWWRGTSPQVLTRARWTATTFQAMARSGPKLKRPSFCGRMRLSSSAKSEPGWQPGRHNPRLGSVLLRAELRALRATRLSLREDESTPPRP